MNEVMMNDNGDNDNELRNANLVKRPVNWPDVCKQTKVEMAWLAKEERRRRSARDASMSSRSRRQHRVGLSRRHPSNVRCHERDASERCRINVVWISIFLVIHSSLAIDDISSVACSCIFWTAFVCQRRTDTHIDRCVCVCVCVANNCTWYVMR